MFGVGEVEVSGGVGTARLAPQVTNLTGAANQRIFWDGDSLTGSVGVDVLHLPGRSLQVHLINDGDVSVRVDLVDLPLVLLQLGQLCLACEDHPPGLSLFSDPAELLLVWSTALDTLIHSLVDELLRHQLGSLAGRLLPVLLEDPLQLFLGW